MPHLGESDDWRAAAKEPRTGITQRSPSRMRRWPVKRNNRPGNRSGGRLGVGGGDELATAQGGLCEGGRARGSLSLRGAGQGCATAARGPATRQLARLQRQGKLWRRRRMPGEGRRLLRTRRSQGGEAVLGGVARGVHGVDPAAARVVMPIATMHEDGEAPSSVREIGRARQRARVGPKMKACLPKHPCNDEFGRGPFWRTAFIRRVESAVGTAVTC